MGDTISVTIGAETFTPVRFNSFTVGPYTCAGKVRQGETSAEAFARVFTVAEAMFKTDFESKTRDHLGRVRTAAETASAMSGAPRG